MPDGDVSRRVGTTGAIHLHQPDHDPGKPGADDHDTGSARPPDHRIRDVGRRTMIYRTASSWRGAT